MRIMFMQRSGLDSRFAISLDMYIFFRIYKDPLRHKSVGKANID